MNNREKRFDRQVGQTLMLGLIISFILFSIDGDGGALMGLFISYVIAFVLVQLLKRFDED